MRKFYSSVIFFAFAMVFCITQSVAQDVVMGTGSEFTTCSGFFADSGAGGADYSNNEYFEITVCPDTPGDVMNLVINTFDLDQTGPQNTWDYLAIFDGNSTDANSLGVYTGADAGVVVGATISATLQNTSGCLTFVWDTNGEGVGNLAGFFSCETPCDRPTAVATSDAPTDGRICIGDEITFDGTGSFAAPGFNIESFEWDFGDGTTNSETFNPTHTWEDPGIYLVELYLFDDNGCASANLINLQVQVATPPTWDPFPGSTTLCIGESLTMDAYPDDYELTWTGAETEFSNSEDYVLEDVLGAPNESEINVTGFEPGQTLDDISDLSFGVIMNHSFLFDLVISVECPSGESILMHQQMAQPGAGDVGANGTDLGVPDGDFYDYTWTHDAAETWSQVATTGDNNSLPEGEYATLEPMDGLLGCDLNGTWTLTIIDNWLGDDGELSEWYLDFNPAIIPDAPEFTPNIGVYTDSSFWEFTPPTGLANALISSDGNTISFDTAEEGVWDFTYTAINDHGCVNDSTITVTVEEALQAEAGPDLVFCGDLVFEGGLADIPSPQCNGVSGNYTYCYESSQNAEFTYCPDNPGDGITFIDITFNAGTVENFFDEFYVYDGPDTSSPLLAGIDQPIYGDLAGLTFVATNPDGCLTIQVTPDGVVDCANGTQTEWDYTVGCSISQPPYVYEWTPNDNLSDPTIPTPTLTALDQETTYTLQVYPEGRPECASFDEMTVRPSFEYEASSVTAICPNYPSTVQAVIDETSGIGPWTIELYEDGALMQTVESTGGTTTFDELYSNNYDMIITEGNCTFEEEFDLNIPVGLTLTTSQDTTVCIGGTATLEAELDQAVDNLVFYWSSGEFGTNTIDVFPGIDAEITVYGEFGQGCFTTTDTIQVDLYDPLAVSVFNVDGICFGDSAFVSVDIETGGLPDYNYAWTADGASVSQLPSQWVSPAETETWCLTLSDACETPAVETCVDVVVDLEIPTTFEADTLGGCHPFFVNFTADSDNEDAVVSAFWDFGDGESSTSFHNASHNYLEDGLFDVSYTVTSEIGCVYETDLSELIYVLNQPMADFTTDPVTQVLPNTSFDFVNYTTSADTYLWTFDDYGSSEEFQPEFTFPDGQVSVYTVSLEVENAFGCTDSITRQVLVIEDFVVYVPNSFTPDNDGINDIFGIEGIDIDESDFIFQIFDRWGEVVFSTDDINVFWNGSVNNGEYYARPGVYVYRIEIQSLTTGEPKEIIGHVHLIR